MRVSNRAGTILEYALIGALFFLYLFSFDLGSSVNSKEEVFEQDSGYILEALEESRPYPWNPQHHLLYHHTVERGYEIWKRLLPDVPHSAYRFLKLFTALTGLGFLLSMRVVFRRMGLGPLQRSALLALTGLSLSAWFKFSAFETFCLAMPFLALYLAAVYSMIRDHRATGWNRLLLVASLTLCVWTRTDLWRLVFVTGALLLLPACRNLRRTLIVDLAWVVVIGGLGTTLLARSYFDASWIQTAKRVVRRVDRPTLRGALLQPSNLHPDHLFRVGRALGVYGLIMPLGETARVMDIADVERIRYFSEPLGNLVRRPLPAATLAGVLVLLGTTLVRAVRRMTRGDPFVVFLTLHGVAGWFFYTWFNPFEPFLWIPPFQPLLMAAWARVSRNDPPGAWIALALLAAMVGLHNYLNFYLAFR